MCFRQTEHSRSLPSSWPYCVIYPLRHKIGFDQVKQPNLMARFNAGCVIIAGGLTKSFEFRLIIQNLVHFIDVVAFLQKDNAEAFVGFSDNARKHSLCIVKSRESIVLSQYKCVRSASWASKAVRCSIELAL